MFKQQAEIRPSTSHPWGSQPSREAQTGQCLSLGGLYLALSSTHRWGIGSPVSWAHLSVCLHELESLHQAQRLLHAAPHGQVIDAQVLDDPVWVDDEQTSAMEQQLREGKECTISARQLLLVPCSS